MSFLRQRRRFHYRQMSQWSHLKHQSDHHHLYHLKNLPDQLLRSASQRFWLPSKVRYLMQPIFEVKAFELRRYHSLLRKRQQDQASLIDLGLGTPFGDWSLTCRCSQLLGSQYCCNMSTLQSEVSPHWTKLRFYRQCLDSESLVNQRSKDLSYR